MKVIASFLTEQECHTYISKNKLDNVLIERDLFSGKFNILDLN
jgi:hypothetical protein